VNYKILQGGESMNVSQVLVRDIETAGTDTPLLELARRMRERGIGFMPILEGDKLVGVITDRDIVMRAVSEVKDTETARASDVMSVEVVCCFEDDSTEHARELMAEHNLRRLPVIDHDHHLVGIVKLPDLEGQSTSIKKALKVSFHKEKTDSYGRPHKVPIKTVYITGAKGREAAEAAAVKRMEEEQGTAWTNVADGMETTEEP
jgi:CBS domain-containing protein